MIGVDPIFIVPWFILLAIAIASGMKWGFKSAAIVFGIGVVVLIALFCAFIVLYYASGGH